ncbi:hypothetical protein ACH4Y0_36275 [Streptomyces sp. NPDC020707]|uniref:hypothetical protein n=1 Tax=Streptomyces sp. NPDC020707 TaxID=3365084 RepID=UPI003797020E
MPTATPLVSPGTSKDCCTCRPAVRRRRTSSGNWPLNDLDGTDSPVAEELRDLLLSRVG